MGIRIHKGWEIYYMWDGDKVPSWRLGGFCSGDG